MPRSRYSRITKAHITRFQEALSALDKADDEHGNWEHAHRHLIGHEHQRVRGDRYVGHDNARVLTDFTELHMLLGEASKGKLKGKRILQLGAANGIYSRFLQEKCGAKAVPLDINWNSLLEATHRKTRNAVQANAIRQEHATGKFTLSKGGVLFPEKVTHHLPFRSRVFDYVVCDHFLFSNYHKGFNYPGFEEHDGSIERSEETLRELNRVLKMGGRAIIATTHADIIDFQKYQPRFRIHGLMVERAYDGNAFYYSTRERTHLILRKVAEEGVAPPRRRRIVK